jgi:hypothetical protein
MSYLKSVNKLPKEIDSDKKSISYLLWGICIIAATVGLFTANSFETFLGCLIWPLLFSLLWRPGEPPVLLFAATFQSVQVFIPVIIADLAGESLQQSLQVQSDISSAFYLGIIAILVLAFGMYLGSSKLTKYSGYFQAKMNESGSELNVYRLALFYTVILIFSLTINSIAFSESGLTQLLLAISSLRWFAVFLIAWSGFRYRQFQILAICVTILEILIGITGFFSGFKTVLFVMLVVYGGTSTKISRLFRPQILILLSLILILTTYWQGVKSDYRSYVNLGSRTQTVQVSLFERLSYHGEAISKLDVEEIKNGFDSGLERLGYLKFFGGSIKTVPSIIPHQNGKLWSEAFANLAPRFLFPNKPIIDDSIRTNIFTGFRVAGAAQGASVSIGYVGESYIDFGVPLMFLPVFGLGYFWGWLYQFLTRTGAYPLLGMAAATTLLLNSAIYFESSNLKLVGGATSAALVYVVFLYFGSNLVWSWLIGKSQKSN